MLRDLRRADECADGWKAYHGQRPTMIKQVIGDTIADLDAVLRIFSSLTRIAQLDGRGAFRTVNLVEIASEGCQQPRCRGEQDSFRVALSATLRCW
jgi:hypothetical protein